MLCFRFVVFLTENICSDDWILSYPIISAIYLMNNEQIKTKKVSGIYRSLLKSEQLFTVLRFSPQLLYQHYFLQSAGLPPGQRGATI